MTNEDLLNYLQEILGNYFTTVKIPEEFTGKDLYGLFKSQKIDRLPFLAKIEGHSVSDIILNFSSLSWVGKIMVISSSGSFTANKVYPIPIAFVGNWTKSSFAPILNPMDAKLAKMPIPKEWFKHRSQTGDAASDKLSIYLNHNLDLKNLIKSYKSTYTSSSGNVSTTYHHPQSIRIQPVADHPGLVLITVHEFVDFHPKKDNFFPKHDFRKTWEVMDLVVNKYREFTGAVDFTNYPHDPYLGGPEAFVCKNCESLMFPDSVYFVKKIVPPFNRGKIDPTPDSYSLESRCPNCGEKRNVLSHRDDLKTLRAASELFWVCPKDLVPYQILKEEFKKDVAEYPVQCPQCNQKVKKEVGFDFIDIVGQGKTLESKNIQKRPGSNYVEYNF